MKHKLISLSKEELQYLLRKQDEEIRNKEKIILKQEKQNLKQNGKIVILHKEVKSLNKMMLNLNSKIAALTKKIFGKSSEKLSKIKEQSGKEGSDIKIFPEKRSEKGDETKGVKKEIVISPKIYQGMKYSMNYQILN
jgi:hypothetical protein